MIEEFSIMEKNSELMDPTQSRTIEKKTRMEEPGENEKEIEY